MNALTAHFFFETLGQLQKSHRRFEFEEIFGRKIGAHSEGTEQFVTSFSVLWMYHS